MQIYLIPSTGKVAIAPTHTANKIIPTTSSVVLNGFNSSCCMDSIFDSGRV